MGSYDDYIDINFPMVGKELGKEEEKKLDDGIYVEKCDKTDCVYYDSRGFCHYETCIAGDKSMPKCHSTFMRICAMCRQEKDFTNLRGDICRSCIADLISVTIATDRLLVETKDLIETEDKE